MRSASEADRVPVGSVFGRLEVVRNPYQKVLAGYGRRWACWCRCECGNEKEVWAGALLTGNTQSCGCLHKERTRQANSTHGEGHSPLYNCWCGVKDRCYNPKNKRWNRYGGRGIVVCDQWLNDFVAFREWALANGYVEGLTIERKDVDGHYEPINCTWIPAAEQALNTRRTRLVTAFGETRIFQRWADDPRCKVSRLVLKQRIDAGWDPEEAITRPPQRKGDPDYKRGKRRK